MPVLQLPHSNPKTVPMGCGPCAVSRRCIKKGTGGRGSDMDNIKFGKFIRESRREKGLTQKQLAEMLHVSDKAVSKWENGVGFPDIKLLEPLADCLDVSILELMQSEKLPQKQIGKEEAEQIVSDTISRSEQLEKRRVQMWRVKILLGACICGILYLIWIGCGYLLGQKNGETTAIWYENPVAFYVWVGLLVILCGASAIWLLWKNEQISDVKIGRHRIKSILTILMDILVVLVLHTYMSNIVNNREQLLKLPDAIPVTGYVSTLDGTRSAGIFIGEEIVERISESDYVDEVKMSVRLKCSLQKIAYRDWDHLNLYVFGANRIGAVRGLEPSEVTWNAGEDASVLEGEEPKCIVSQKLFEKNGWRLGEKITLCQYYYHEREDIMGDLLADPLKDTEYEIAGYADLSPSALHMDSGLDGFLPDILVPIKAVRNDYADAGIPFEADTLSFRVSDALMLNEFKQDMKELGLKSIAPMTSDNSLTGTALVLNDSAFINAASQLRRAIDTVTAFFPFLLTLIVCVGYLVTLLLLQSRKKEMALLRSIGLNRRKCFRVFFTEQLILVVTGVTAGSMLSVLLQGNYGGSSVLTGCLVAFCYMLGNSLALYKLLKVSVMEALFRTD